MKRNSYKLSGLSIKRKRILLNPYSLILIPFLLILTTVLTGCVKREVKNLDSKGKNIVCFGTSITFGYGAAPGESYPSALAELTGMPVVNAGLDGDASSEAVMRLKSDVLDKNPLLVIIEFGGNDFLRRMPRETTLSNIRLIVDRVQEKGAMAAIVDISVGMMLSEYYSAFYELSREKGAIFIPRILNGVITNPKLKSDFMHPNGAGYKLIAEKIYRRIKPYLEENARIKESAK